MMKLPFITICEPGQPKVFSYTEASALVPLLQRITRNTLKQLNPVLHKISYFPKTDPKHGDAEKVYQDIVQRWVNKMIRLGIEVKGLWIADFDCGYGYFCWKYPEETLLYFHKYHQGFSQRRKLSMNTSELWQRGQAPL